MLNLARIPQHAPTGSPIICPGRRWSRRASCSTRTAASSAPCASAGPTSKARPRPSSSRPAARVNNVLKRFGSGWALFFEAERVEALGYPESQLSRSRLLAGRRGAARRASRAARDHFESRYHLTLLWLPPADAEARAGRALVERTRRASKGATGARRSPRFVAETDRALDLLAGLMPEVRALDDGETLTFLHGTVSAARHPVAVPETPIYLDALLADTPLTGGLEPMLGELHLRTLTLLGFPGAEPARDPRCAQPPGFRLSLGRRASSRSTRPRRPGR